MIKFFETLLNMSITGAVIIAFVMIVRLFLKKLPRKYSYILWIIPAIRLLIPFSLAAPVSVFNFIHIPEPHAVISDSGEVNEPPALTDDIFSEPIADPVTGEGYFASVPDGYVTGEGAPQITGPFYTAEVITGAPAAPNVPEEPDVNVTPDTPDVPDAQVNDNAVALWRAACAVWATGAAAMLCYLAYSYIATKKEVAFSYKIGEAIYSNGQIETPFVFGYIEPRIYIPFGLDDKEFAYVVAHERTHIKRGDHIIKAVASLILCVHWFNPFAWLAFKLMTDDMELSCDERAIDTYDLEVRKEYARTLLNMSVGGSKVPFHGMLSFGESSIKSRIKGVLRMKKPTALACVIAVAVIITASVCLLTNARQTPPDPAGTTDVADTTDGNDTDAPDITDAPDTTEHVETTVPADTDEPPAVDGMIERCFENKLKDYTSTEMKIGITVPEEWSFDGDSATLNGKTVFSFVRAWPQVLGIDPDVFKKTFEGAEAIVEERIGGANDNFSFFMHSKNSKGHRYNYVLLCRGYYVNVYFFDESAVDDATKNAVLASVRVFNDKTKGVGDLIWLVSMDRYTIDVINVDNETVDYLDRSRSEEMFHITIRYVDFLNKHLNITGAPAKISEDVLGFSVTEDCIKYAAVDGVLYTKDMKILVAFPPARTGEYTLPDSVKYIDDNAFYGTKLTKLFVPVGVDKGRLIGAEGLAVETVADEENTTEVTGAVIDVGELTADGKSRYFLVRDGGLVSYRFTAPADSTIKVGDLVTVTFTGEAKKGIKGENNTLSVISNEDPNKTVSAVKHSFSLTVQDSPSLSHLNVDIEFPSDWVRDGNGTVLGRNGVKFFELSSSITPFAMGIDEARFKTSAETEVTVIEERYGTDGDPYAYYIYHSRSGDKYGPDATYDVHSYVVLSNGYYVTLGFLGDADIEREVIDRVLRSVDVSADANGNNGGEIFGELFGDIRYMAIKNGILTLDVVTLDEETVEHIRSFVDEYSKETVTAIVFTNKNLRITCSPTRISERVWSFTVPENCIDYVTVDGVIYSSDNKVLIAMPPARAGTYSLSNSVEKMDDYALFGSKLDSLTISALLNDRGALIGADNVKIYQK